MNGARPREIARRALYISVLVLGVGVFTAAIAWPTMALLIRCATQSASTDPALSYGGRQIELLVRTTGLVGAATLLAHVLAVILVYSLSASGEWWRRPATFVLLATCLACPLPAYAFGWDKVLPATFGGSFRCIWTWAFWAWPVPAMLIGVGWTRHGCGPFQAAALEASRWRAFRHVAFPALRGHAALSLLIVFTFLSNEYIVPHACGLQVYATELLGVASSSPNAVDSLGPAMVPIGIAASALIAMLLIWHRTGETLGSQPVASDVTTTNASVAIPVAVLFGVSWLPPLVGLFIRLGTPAMFVTAVRTYGQDVVTTIAVALAAGLLAAVMGIAAALARRLSWAAVPWALAFGMLPGALVGVALIAAYNAARWGWLFDHWPAIMVGHLARFGWIAVLAGVLLRRLTSSVLLDQARTDGAPAAALFWNVRLPLGWPILAAAGVLVSVLSVGELATTSLLRIPDFNPIVLVMIEKFHRFEDGILASLGLILVGGGVVAATVLGIIAKTVRLRV